MNLKQRKYHREWKHKKKLESPEKYLLDEARDNAAHYHREFTLTINDIHIPKYCPYFGIKLSFNKQRRNSSPSLDRIDNTKGYIPSNVEVISWRANKLKNDATIGELIQFAKTILIRFV